MEGVLALMILIWGMSVYFTFTSQLNGTKKQHVTKIRKNKMKKTNLIVGMVLGLVMLFAISVHAQRRFSGKWIGQGNPSPGTSLIISVVNGNYSAVLYTAQSVSSNHIVLQSSHLLGGVVVYNTYDLTLSDDETVLSGTLTTIVVNKAQYVFN